MPFLPAWLIALVVSYLVGSIPFGLLIGLARGIDVRTQGSGNIGATNVRRVVGKSWGNLAFACDVAKGAGPVLAFGSWLSLLGDTTPSTPRALAFIAIAVATILGHMFPIYLRFKGGKGVATGLGSLTALWPHVTLAALLALATWVSVLKATRYVSIASCAAAIALPLGVLVLPLAGWPNPDTPLPARLAVAAPFVLVTLALAALVIWKHRGNLARLRAGTEPKIGTPLDASRTAPSSEGAEKPGQ
jgi:glycerol-3-phosphate acyltransferase PlsY